MDLKYEERDKIMTRSKKRKRDDSVEKNIDMGKKHTDIYSGWNEKNHYGQCGQSCPCCRWKIGREIFGSCTICMENEN